MADQLWHHALKFLDKYRCVIKYKISIVMILNKQAVRRGNSMPHYGLVQVSRQHWNS